MRARIKDVAQVAGVSPATVSAVLNKNKYVSPELVARINAAMKELDYHPSRVARALRHRTQTLAFVVPDLANAGFVRSLQAVTSVASQRGYTVIVLETKGTPELMTDVVSSLIELRVEGVILSLTWDIAREEAIQALQKNDIRVVGMAGSRIHTTIDCFSWDERGAGTSLSTYLARLGHEEIAFLAPGRSESALRRYNGLCQGLKQHTCHRIETRGYDASDAYQSIVQVAGAKLPFTALITFNDALTSGALAALVDLGFVVPQDVSLATFGGIHTEFSRPRITTMMMDHQELGRRAALRLLDRIEGKCVQDPLAEYLPLTLSIQDSCSRVK